MLDEADFWRDMLTEHQVCPPGAILTGDNVGTQTSVSVQDAVTQTITPDAQDVDTQTTITARVHPTQHLQIR